VIPTSRPLLVETVERRLKQALASSCVLWALVAGPAAVVATLYESGGPTVVEITHSLRIDFTITGGAVLTLLVSVLYIRLTGNALKRLARTTYVTPGIYEPLLKFVDMTLLDAAFTSVTLFPPIAVVLDFIAALLKDLLGGTIVLQLGPNLGIVFIHHPFVYTAPFLLMTGLAAIVLLRGLLKARSELLVGSPPSSFKKRIDRVVTVALLKYAFAMMAAAVPFLKGLTPPLPVKPR